MINEMKNVKLDACTDIDIQIAKLFEKRSLLVSELQNEQDFKLNLKRIEKNTMHSLYNTFPADNIGSLKILAGTVFDLTAAMQKHDGNLASFQKEINNAVKDSPLPDAPRVACQGIDGAYSQTAAEKLFAAPKIMFVKTFDSVFNAVEKKLCDYGILPIENSTAGSVTEIYELMKQHKFYIAGSVKTRVNHTLLAKAQTAMKDITEIFSHEQAISQCSEFIKNNPQIKITVCENTAVAADLVSKSKRFDIAAISSAMCAEFYGLKILNSSVQNSDNNYTRFICISRNLEIYKNADRISLMLQIENKPGALYKLLGKFAALNLNLIKLESRPIAGRDFEFMFYFDIEGSALDNGVQSLCVSLSETCPDFVFLGNYS